MITSLNYEIIKKKNFLKKWYIIFKKNLPPQKIIIINKIAFRKNNNIIKVKINN